MTKERQGEIALALFKAKLLRDGVKLSGDTRRELGRYAKEAGISMEDLSEFLLDILPSVIGAAFGYEEVSLTLKGRRKASTP